MTTPSIVTVGRRLLGLYQLDRASVLDRTVTRTPGGTSETFTLRPGDPLRCSFGQVNDKEATQATDLAHGKALSVVSFPVGTAAIAEGSRIRNVATGREWVVVGKTTPESVMQLQQRYLIREA